MHRTSLTFEKFKINYIDNMFGYLPVYSFLGEDNFGRPLKIIKIDLICEWRVHDGKVMFLQVSFDNQQEFDQILKWLKDGADYLNSEITRRLNDLKYFN